MWGGVHDFKLHDVVHFMGAVRGGGFVLPQVVITVPLPQL